ncbi:MAG: hypothetical protein BWY63_03717 [Chloroflexi bacterium ADurb.Bin360]|nr:MAG: hypothetical protein BWY63_03717 [Chloroflexi bacterium ADurb.Bin360]
MFPGFHDPTCQGNGVAHSFYCCDTAHFKRTAVHNERIQLYFAIQVGVAAPPGIIDGIIFQNPHCSLHSIESRSTREQHLPTCKRRLPATRLKGLAQRCGNVPCTPMYHNDRSFHQSLLNFCVSSGVLLSSRKVCWSVRFNRPNTLRLCSSCHSDQPRSQR